MAASETPSREEVDAKLEAVEARLETRLVSIDGKLDRIVDRVEIAVDAARAASLAASTIKWHIFFSFVGGIAIILAIWALWAQGMAVIATLLQAKG